MLRGSEDNEGPYSEFNALEILLKLLTKGLIELPEQKRPKKVRRTNDPKYYKYDRIISDPIEKCNAFRGKVLQLAKEGKIIFDGEDTEESN